MAFELGDTSHGLLADFQAGLSFKEQLENKYSSKDNHIDFGKYLADLKQTASHSRESSHSPIKSINFLSLKEVKDLPSDHQQQICKLGLKIILNQEIDNDEEANEIIANLGEIDPDLSQKITDMSVMERKAFISLVSSQKNLSKQDLENVIKLCVGVVNEEEISELGKAFNQEDILKKIEVLFAELKTKITIRNKINFLNSDYESLILPINHMQSQTAKSNYIQILLSDKTLFKDLLLESYHPLPVERKGNLFNYLFAFKNIHLANEITLIYLLDNMNLSTEAMKNTADLFEKLNFSYDDKSVDEVFFTLTLASEQTRFQETLVDEVNNYKFNNELEKIKGTLLLTLFPDMDIKDLLKDFSNCSTSPFFYDFISRSHYNIPYKQLVKMGQEFKELDPKCFECRTFELLCHHESTIENLTLMSKLSYYLNKDELHSLFQLPLSEQGVTGRMSKLLTIFEKVPTDVEKSEFIKVLKDLDVKDAQKIIDLLSTKLNELQGDDKKTYADYIFKAMIRTQMNLKTFESLNRIELAKLYFTIRNPKTPQDNIKASLFNSINFSGAKFPFLNALYYLKEEDATEENKKIIEQFIKNSPENFYFLEIKSDFLECCKFLNKITSGIEDEKDTFIFRIILISSYFSFVRIPQKLREDGLEAYINFINNQTNRLEERKTLLDFINLFPKIEDFKEFAKDYQALLKDVSYVFSTIPYKDQLALLNAVKTIDNKKEKKLFIEYALKLKPDELRAGILEDVVKFYKKENPTLTRQNLLETFSIIPRKDRTQQLYNTLLQYSKRSIGGYIHLNLFFKEIPPEKRAKAMIQAIPILANFKKREFYRSTMYAASVIDDPKALKHLQDMPEAETEVDATTLMLCSMIPTNEYTPELYATIRNLVQMGKVGEFYKILGYLPPNLCTPYFIDTFYRQLVYVQGSEKNDTLASFLLTIPPEFYKEVLEIDFNDELNILKHYFQTFFEKIPADVKEAHIKKMLTSITHPSIVKNLAIAIKDNLGVFGIKPDTEVHDYVISAAHVSSYDQQEKHLNPYRIHDYLSSVVPSEPFAEIPLAVEELGDKKVSINLPFLQKQAEWPGYLAKDIPKDVPVTALNDLFGKIETRLNGLSEEERTKVLEDIYEISELKSAGVEGIFKYLKDNLLKSPYIPALMGDEKNPDNVIRKEKYYLYCVLRSILDESNEIQPGERLTPQERSFLTMASMIQFCDEGQYDGVTRCFKLLDEKYKMGAVADVRGNLQKLTENSIQKTLGGIAEDTALLKQLAQNEKLAQINHTVNYVLNRFGRQIGLKHEIRFDFHTHVLNPALIDRSADSALPLIFAKITPKVFVKNLMNVANQDPKGLKDFFAGMEELFRLDGKGLIDEGYVGMDEDMIEFELTEKGAAAILQSLGYLKEVKGS